MEADVVLDGDSLRLEGDRLLVTGKVAHLGAEQAEVDDCTLERCTVTEALRFDGGQVVGHVYLEQAWMGTLRVRGKLQVDPNAEATFGKVVALAANLVFAEVGNLEATKAELGSVTARAVEVERLEVTEDVERLRVADLSAKELRGEDVVVGRGRRANAPAELQLAKHGQLVVHSARKQEATVRLDGASGQVSAEVLRGDAVRAARVTADDEVVVGRAPARGSVIPIPLPGKPGRLVVHDGQADEPKVVLDGADGDVVVAGVGALGALVRELQAEVSHLRGRVEALESERG